MRDAPGRAGSPRVANFSAKRQQILGHDASGRGRELRRGPGRARRPAGSLGLWEIDDAAADRRPRTGHERPDFHRRQGCDRATSGQTPHLDGVSVLRAVSASDRRREHSIRAARAQGACGRADAASEPRGGAARSRCAARTQAVAAFRRSAATRRAGPRHYRGDAGLPDGRAAVQSRCTTTRRDAPRDSCVAAAARHHHGLCHSRSERGDEHGRPRHSHARRPRRTGSGAGRPLR